MLLDVCLSELDNYDLIQYLIRKERNLLLSSATEKNATEKNAEKNEAREDKHKDDDTLSLASSYRNDTNKEKEKQDFSSFLAVYDRRN